LWFGLGGHPRTNGGKEMKRYSLIGKSLNHSFSKNFFSKYFEEKGINAIYVNSELESIEDFELIKGDFDGFNVTIPYKTSIIPFLSSCDPIAEKVGAVNTIKVVNGKFIGYNTDVIGFANMIKPFLTNQHERALILGKGGASKAVTFVLESLGIECLYLTRNKESEFDYSYDEANELMIANCKLIINTTPVGMFPNVSDSIHLPYEGISGDHLLIDLIYNPDETLFLRRGREQGAQTLNGLSMLKEQALAAYRIWNE
jgi:shikimate dehydrogenase